MKKKIPKKAQKLLLTAVAIYKLNKREEYCKEWRINV